MTEKIKVNLDPKVFNNAYLPYVNKENSTQIYYGGGSSGKSVFLAQRDVYKLLKGGRNILICRQVGRTLRGSVVQEMTKIIRDWNLSRLFEINKTDGTITCVNGYQAVFAGLDDVEKIKSITPAKGVFTDVRIEEATETDRASVKQLEKRLRGGDEEVEKTITLSFNPILQQHWIYKEYFEGIGWADIQTVYESPDLFILKTTYKDNRFLTRQDVYKLENEKDAYFYNVYTLGNWGVLGNIIFKNWRVEDLSGMADQWTNQRIGQDFGYSDDPAATVFTHYDSMRKRIYIFDENYEKNLSNEGLAQILNDKVAGYPVTCDSAEPKSIARLQELGVMARPAAKGKDSVNFGISWLREQEIIVDKKCVNMQRELQQYKWKEDAGGNVLPVPVDKYNHLIDALRYAYEGDMQDAWLIS